MRADRDVVVHGQSGERLHDLEGAGDAAPRQAVRGLAGDVGPAVQMRPSLGGRKPVMMANSVVLPAPFGPISAVMRPASRGKRRAVEGQQTAEAPGHPLDAQERLSHGVCSGAAAGCERRKRSRRSANTPAMPRGANATTRISTQP